MDQLLLRCSHVHKISEVNMIESTPKNRITFNFNLMSIHRCTDAKCNLHIKCSNINYSQEIPVCKGNPLSFAVDSVALHLINIPLNNRNQTNVDEIETISSPFHINVRCWFREIMKQSKPCYNNKFNWTEKNYVI